MICVIKFVQMLSFELHVHFSFLSISQFARGVLLSI